MPRTYFAPGGSAGHLHADLLPDGDAELNDGRTLFEFAPFSRYRAAWCCRNCEHRWQTEIANRTRLKSGCPKCKRAAGYTVVRIRQHDLPYMQLQHARLFQLNFKFSRATNDYAEKLPRLKVDIQELLGFS